MLQRQANEVGKWRRDGLERSSATPKYHAGADDGCFHLASKVSPDYPAKVEVYGQLWGRLINRLTLLEISASESEVNTRYVL